MKSIKYFLILSLALAFALSCDDGIDPISKVDPGPDQTAPTVNITFPLEGTQIRTQEEPATVVIKFDAKDDIELTSVSLQLDGTEIEKYDEFKDYRQITQEFTFSNLTQGDHTLSIVATDLSGKTTTQTVNFEKTVPYVALYEGEVLYLPFDGDYTEQITNTLAAKVGTPDSYLTFPTTNLTKTTQVSAVFWMKINATPDRAGILIMSPEDPEHPDLQNKRTSGFRFFREKSGALQIFKLNVGIGNEKESWNDGGTVDPTAGEWVHFAFTVSETKSNVYINGVMKREGTLETPIDWAGTDQLVIMSGGPRFAEWEHYSDLSLLDELRIFNKALTAEEITTIMNAQN